MKRSKIILSLCASLQLLLPMSGLVVSQPAQAINWNWWRRLAPETQYKTKGFGVLAAVAALGYAGCALKNWWDIDTWRIETTAKSSASNRNVRSKIYMWAEETYPTAAHVRANVASVQKQLKDDWKAGNLIILNAGNAPINNNYNAITKADVLYTINRENTELQEYIDKLLPYTRCYGFLDGMLSPVHGANKLHDDICGELGCGTDHSKWSMQQADAVDKRMRAECATRWHHFLPIPWLAFKLNHGQAARAWWRLHRLLERNNQLIIVVDRMDQRAPAQRYELMHQGGVGLAHADPYAPGGPGGQGGGGMYPALHQQ